MTNRRFGATILALSLVLCTVTPAADRGELKVEIQNIPDRLLLVQNESGIDVEGSASVFGGLKYLDLFLILDASRSLNRTDPDDYRVKGATALIRALPPKSDVRIGIVTFDSGARLVSPLTADREAIIEKLQTIERDGGTNLHDGIYRALEGFEQDARPEAAQTAMLFTDGKSDRARAIAAAQAAHAQGVSIHSLLLLDRDKSADLLRTIAGTTQGSFVYVDDPENLPQAFMDLRTTGVDHVKLSVDGGAPIDTQFVAGYFSGPVPLRPGKNLIRATATDLEGAQAHDDVEVTVTGPLRVAIASPVDGTQFVGRESETEVAINASVFSDPTDALRQAFPTLGVDGVVLSSGGSPPIPAEFVDGRFVATVPLGFEANRITAIATSFDGRTAEAFVDVSVRSPGCARLRVSALRDGQPALSLDDRGLEVIFDASGSMWGQIDGTAKITIAKNTVRDAMVGFPEDFYVALRVYGHQHHKDEHNCTDSELLIPLGRGQGDQIRNAIEVFKPRGQTPLGYSVEQLPADFGNFAGERAAVLITDGIESCDGDAVAAARAFQEEGRHRPIHVIGFGFEPGQHQALASLRMIAETTDGKFIMAGDGGELRRALAATAGTSFSIWQGARHVDSGTLGANEIFQFPAGDYVLRLESDPPRQFPFHVEPEEALSLTLVREEDRVFSSESREPTIFIPCEETQGVVNY